MKWMLRILISLFCIFLLAGCIAEDYDFSPPNVYISSQPDLVEGELEAANIDWNSDKVYKKTTEEIYSLASEQKPLHYYSGQQMNIWFENQDFAVKALSVYVSQNDEKTELLVEDRLFELPKEEGEYVIVLDLLADSGNAQYIGNLVVENKDDYPYPPTASISTNFDKTSEEKLTEMKADWQLPKDNGKYTVETDDMSSFLKEQKQLQYHAGQPIEIVFDHQNFEVKTLKVYLEQDGESTLLPTIGNTFDLPVAGEYVITVDLLTDKGSVEYAGNILVLE